MGINPEGRGVQDAEFFARAGARVIATDMKRARDVKESAARLKKYKNVSLVLGRHRMRDFTGRDLVIRAASVPLHSPYIQEAIRSNTEIQTDETFFLKFAPPVTLVGVTGTKGKSTVTQMIYHIVKHAGRRAFLAGNVRGQAAIALLGKIGAGDIVVMELDSWKLQQFGEEKISPGVAVFTNFFPDHLNYYRGNMRKYFQDKANIFRFQKYGDTLVVGASARSAMRRYFSGTIHGAVLNAKEKDIPGSWKLLIFGKHNRENAALAMSACGVLGLSAKEIKRGIETFPGVSGRLELVRALGGVRYYNDTTATVPEATLAALNALNSRRVIVLLGGADKKLNYRIFAIKIGVHRPRLVLFEGPATDKIMRELKRARYENILGDVSSMKDAVRLARASAKRGDIVLLSPAAASFGMFKNEYDRGDQFCALVRSLRA